MYLIYSPELKQIPAHSRFSNVAADLARYLCEKENGGRLVPHFVTFQVIEADTIPEPGDGWRRDPPPEGRLVGTVTMQQTGYEARVDGEGWSW